MKCRQIINGTRCTNDRVRRGEFCPTCARERNRIANIASYHKNKTGWLQYYKTCKCGAEYLIENPRQSRRIDCNDCRVKRLAAYPSKAAKKSYKENRNKSLKQSTQCKCPTCEGKYKLRLHLHANERIKVDAGRPHRRRCELCKKHIGRDGICDEIGHKWGG